MNLKEARAIARSVGATIEEKKELIHAGEGALSLPSYDTVYVVRLGVCKIGENGTRTMPVLHGGTPREAADLAVIETGRAARALVEVAKRVYSDSDLIFGAPKS